MLRVLLLTILIPGLYGLFNVFDTVRFKPEACMNQGLEGTCVTPQDCSGTWTQTCSQGYGVCCVPMAEVVCTTPDSFPGTCITAKQCIESGGTYPAYTCDNGGGGGGVCCIPKDNVAPAPPAVADVVCATTTVGVSGTCLTSSACAGTGGSWAGTCTVTPGVPGICCQPPPSSGDVLLAEREILQDTLVAEDGAILELPFLMSALSAVQERLNPDPECCQSDYTLECTVVDVHSSVLGGQVVILPGNVILQLEGTVGENPNAFHYTGEEGWDAVITLNPKSGTVFAHATNAAGESFTLESCSEGQVWKSIDMDNLDDYETMDLDLDFLEPIGNATFQFSFDEEIHLLKSGIMDDDQIVTYSVKVYYTREFEKTTSDVVGFIDQVIAETNQGYINSKVPLRVEKHCHELATIKEFSNPFIMMDKFTKMKGTAAELRDTADAAALLVNESTACGIGYFNTISTGMTITVTNKLCALGYYSFGHELGHNIGLAHNKAKTTNKVNQYGHGHLVEKGSAKTGVRTILSYNKEGHKRRVNFYSSADMIYEQTGTPLGLEDIADNARVLRENRFLISNVGDESSSCAADNPIIPSTPSNKPAITNILTNNPNTPSTTKPNNPNEPGSSPNSGVSGSKLNPLDALLKPLTALLNSLNPVEDAINTVLFPFNLVTAIISVTQNSNLRPDQLFDALAQSIQQMEDSLDLGLGSHRPKKRESKKNLELDLNLDLGQLTKEFMDKLDLGFDLAQLMTDFNDNLDLGSSLDKMIQEFENNLDFGLDLDQPKRKMKKELDLGLNLDLGFDLDQLIKGFKNNLDLGLNLDLGFDLDQLIKGFKNNLDLGFNLDLGLDLDLIPNLGESEVLNTIANGL